MGTRGLGIAAALASALLAPALPATSAAPPRLELYLIVDDTASLTVARASVVALADALARAADRRRDLVVAIGLGTVTDVTAVDHTQPRVGHVYRRVFAPTLQRGIVRDEVRKLRARGGGDEPEAQLTALEQAVTGSGRLPWVEPAQDARFTPGARKVVVLVTDATYHEDGLFYPVRDDVVRLLRGHGVGLAVLLPNNPYNDVERAIDDYRSLADDVGPLVRSAYDVDGDGQVDIAPGNGLVTAFGGPSGVRDRTNYGGLATMLLHELGGARR